MNIRFDGRVAVVTGAGNGLGRAHALGLAARGAKVVVNDLSQATAQAVADEITQAGGQAIALAANVADVEQVKQTVEHVMTTWGRIDILVNNAGILRDKTFAKMEMSDFQLIVDVHLMGSAYFSKAVWDIMRAQQYGRIVMTTSTSGIYGNFGQSNYAAAKSGVVGLMNVLAIEGIKNNIHVNSLAPTAATAMTQGLLSPEALAQLAPELITPGLLYLVSEQAPNGIIMGAGAGCFTVSKMVESDGVYFDPSHLTPEDIAARFDDISNLPETNTPKTAFDQTSKYIKKAGFTLG